MSFAGIKLMAGRDIEAVTMTESNKKSERNSLQAQRAETLALLAAGVAHDLTNILVDIMGNLSLARLHAAGNRDVEAHLSICKEGCVRASRLAEQLLRFAGPGPSQRRLVELQGVIVENAVLAARGSRVSCEFDIPDGLWRCVCDADQVAQVMANLVLNARQALPGVGTIRVCAGNVTLAPGEVAGLEGGEYVRVRVQDCGAGIPAGEISKIFEPSYTTRPGSRGLGLAVARTIIVDHGGHIEAASEPGLGTTVTLYLPAGPASTNQPGP
jgi:signal transduction histidine kinase